MGFVADYAGQKKKGFSLGAIVLAATIGITSGYCLKCCGNDYRSNGNNSYSSLESRNLRSLEGLLSKKSSITGPQDSSSDISDLMFDFWKSLPEENKKEITKKNCERASGSLVVQI